MLPIVQNVHICSEYEQRCEQNNLYYIHKTICTILSTKGLCNITIFPNLPQFLCQHRIPKDIL